GILNMLMYKGFEYVVTQSFSFMPKRDGVDFLDRQEKRLRNTEDGSVSQLVAMAEAKDSLINGEFAMGEYHFSMMVFGDSMDSVRSNTTEA
ncbi:type IV secretion protein C, partial [Xanthomonas citri pv. citri]|nr:type IV secretion protein C [Xanthomonas citri pv. citri]